MSDRVIEVYTKKLLSDDFKDKDLTITFLKSWSHEHIAKWQKGKYWFQGFEWLLPDNKT